MAKSSKKDLARARRRRRQTGIVHLEGVSAPAQAGTITVSDTPLPARAEADAAILSNWYQPLSQPLPPRSTIVIQGGPASPPFRPPVNEDVPITGVALSTEGGTYTISGAADVTVDADVIPAPEVTSQLPFSEIAIAERLAANPDFYRRLLRIAADELKREIVLSEGKPLTGNSGAVISAELGLFQRGFDSAATDLESSNSDRFTRAGKTLAAIRDSVGQFCENYPALARTFFQLPAVTLGVYVLHQVGVPAELGALISAAIVRNEKLADLLGRRSKEDKDENPPA
jgi:hypothetical protein